MAYHIRYNAYGRMIKTIPGRSVATLELARLRAETVVL
jgi:hypothetical protein